MELPPRTSLAYENGVVRFIDQRTLPGTPRVVETIHYRVIENAIVSLAIRGAPLIGIAAAFGVALEARSSIEDRLIRSRIGKAINRLRATRPTAVNLFAALQRMEAVASRTDDDELPVAMEATALSILEDDRQFCNLIADEGVELIPDDAVILTICNTGFLATGGIGTALGVVYRAFDQGKVKRVLVPETRPLLQGSRLTMWELTQAGIPCRLFPDGAVGAILRRRVDLAIIGADRISANGDTANKIGSLPMALACRAFKVPLYVAAPSTTFDYACPSGASIAIEDRSPDEVTSFRGYSSAPEGVSVFNPAFDVVEADLIRGFITDKGILHPPYKFA